MSLLRHYDVKILSSSADSCPCSFHWPCLFIGFLYLCFFLFILDFENRNDLLVKVLALEKCVNSLICKINVLMRFVLMQEETEFVGMKDVRYRKDVVFSQSVCLVFFLVFFFLLIFVELWQKGLSFSFFYLIIETSDRQDICGFLHIPFCYVILCS